MVNAFVVGGNSYEGTSPKQSRIRTAISTNSLQTLFLHCFFIVDIFFTCRSLFTLAGAGRSRYGGNRRKIITAMPGNGSQVNHINSQRNCYPTNQPSALTKTVTIFDVCCFLLLHSQMVETLAGWQLEQKQQNRLAKKKGFESWLWLAPRGNYLHFLTDTSVSVHNT